MALRTWKQFLEGKGCDAHTKKAADALEDMEEKLGKDLDDDDEEGEEHADKVFAKSKKSKK
jgi:uncharacterized protein YgfB (UPF0149 family)